MTSLNDTRNPINAHSLVNTPTFHRNENTLPRLRNEGEVYNDDRVVVNQYQLTYRMDPDTRQKVEHLERSIANGTAQASDYVELDLFYQIREFRPEHQRIKGLMKTHFPNSGELFFLHGIEHFFGKKNKAAIKDFNRVQDADFKSGLMFNSYGAIHQRQGDTLTAEMWFRRAIDLESTYEVPYYNLAAIHLARGELVEAEKLLLKSLSLNPCYDRPYSGLAKVITLPNLLSTRVQLARIALVLEPFNSDAASLVGDLHIKMKLFEKLASLPFDKISKIKNKLKVIKNEFAPPGTSMEDFFAGREKMYRVYIRYAQSLN